MKTILVLVGTLLAFQAANADEWRKHWNVGGKPELHVTSGDVSVELIPGSKDVIDATLTTRGWTIGNDNGLRVTEHQNGNRVEIEIRMPQTRFNWNTGNRSGRLEVHVPRELMADIHTGDGSIKLRDLAGTFRAQSGDGGIDADHLDGALDLHTGDGSVHVNGRFDNVQLHTGDGSVDVDVLRGSRLDRDWRIQTGDGSVRLALPKDLNADVEMHTGDGHIQMDLPLKVSGTRGEHSIQGKLNAGGALLTVRTGDGSIAVSAS